MKLGMICLSHAAQLSVLNGCKRSPTTFMNQAPFHSTFPILVITKIFGTYVCPSVTKSVTIREFYFTCLAVHRTITFSAMAAL